MPNLSKCQATISIQTKFATHTMSADEHHQQTAMGESGPIMQSAVDSHYAIGNGEARRKADLIQLDLELPRKHEAINNLAKELQKLDYKCARLRKAAPHPLEGFRYEKMKELYEQAAARDKTTARSDPPPQSQLQLQQHQKAFFQLAGHKESFRLGTRSDTILKKSTGNEEACLKKLMSDNKLSPFVPRILRDIELDGQHYLEMQDLLVNFVNPLVMDIKMGCRTYREEELGSALKEAKLRHDMYDKMIEVDVHEPTNEEKEVKAITKPRYMIWRETVSSTASLGFRIEGMRLKDGSVDKEFKTIKDEEQIIKAFMRYAKSSKIRLKYLNRLYDLRRALIQSNFFWTHELIGSSLLFVHDDDEANIWLIDFAKTDLLPEDRRITHKNKWELGNHEDGYLIGIENLIRLFEKLNSLTADHQAN